MIEIILLVLTFLVAAASLVPLLRFRVWWVRIFDFPRAQIFALGALVFAGLLLFTTLDTWLDGAALGLLALALALQAFRIFPYTPLAPKEVQAATRDLPEASLSLLIANVRMSNRNAGRLLKTIRNRKPDVILTLEPDSWWETQLRILDDDWPYMVKEPLDNRYGMLLHSRLELVAPEVKHLLTDRIPSIHTQVRLPSGDVVWLHCLHPEPPTPTEAETSTERDAELLIVGREVKDRDVPTIVAGDLNDVAWSRTTTRFQKISGLLDPRKGRGMYNTFHAEYALMRWPLDHIFHSDHFFLDALERLPAFGSDHFPVYARLVLHPRAEAAQDEPEADREDQEAANEAIDKARNT